MSRSIAVLSLVALTALTGLTACGTEPEARMDDARAEGAQSAPAQASPAQTSPGTGAANGRTARAEPVATTRTILFVGTSLTAGYGVGEDVAYPAVLQEKIDSAGLPYRVVNAGISGETSAGGLRRIDWSLQQPVDVLVLELGANDGLRGLDPDAMRSNLDEIMTRTRRRYPDAAILLVGMEAPPNLGSSYTGRFRRVYEDLARQHDAVLVPFLLENVAGERDLNIDDGIHPNARGHRIIAGTVWRQLGPLLEQRALQPASGDRS